MTAMETFTINPPGLDWSLGFIFGGIVLFLLVVAAIAWRLEADAPGMICGFLAVCLAIVGIAAVPNTAHSVQYKEVQKLRQEGITSLGYSNVVLTEEHFIGSDEDGKYVTGVLVDLGDNTYTVLETTE